MALITCSECGKELSSTAERCPHCGHKTEFAKDSAKKRDIAWAVYISLGAFVIGLLLLIPNLFTLMDNYNDYYFWNYYTERSDAVMRNIGIGVGLTGSGLGVFLATLKQVKKQNQENK